MMMPTSSKVSRTAAIARPRARVGVAGPRMRANSLSRAAGSRSAIGSMRQSAGSRRPPGKTNLLGMKACEAWRLPISTRGVAMPSRRTMMRVAASRGRRAREASGGFNLIDLGTAALGQCSIFEAMHPERPLQGDDRALHVGQDHHGHDDGQRHPEAQMNEDGGMPEVLGNQRERQDDMADEKHGEIGRGFIGAVMIELLAAMAATLEHLQIGGEQRSRAAMRAEAGEAKPERAPYRALVRRMVGGG